MNQDTALLLIALTSAALLISLTTLIIGLYVTNKARKKVEVAQVQLSAYQQEFSRFIFALENI